MNNISEDRIYTYENYKNYPEGERIEIINGHIYDRAAAPSRIHQKIISKIMTLLNNYIDSNNGTCEIYMISSRFVSTI